MNKTFLNRVASDLINRFGTNLSRVAVVFPNKRASLFMNEHLAREAGKPIWSPAYTTISELFRKHSETEVADPIKLVTDLHKVFTGITGKEETLDQFYGWGQLLISDFDDIDKNMADASKVLANVTDLKELDDLSYLSEEQKELLSKFFSNFSLDQNTVLKKRFLSIWKNLFNIYTAFNEKLQSQQLAYEGALYRQVATSEKLVLDYDVYVFVGFNMLQKVEQHLFSRIMNESQALFYWDFDDYYMHGSESGHFIQQYLPHFPNALPNDDPIYDNFSKAKDMTYIAAATETAQARYAAQWLREPGKKRIEDGRHTAIVLCDESLLPSIVHALPEEVGKVNITTGYPLSLSPFAALVNHLIALQTDGYDRQNQRYRLPFVLRVLRHPYGVHVCQKNLELIEKLTKDSIFRPTREVLSEFDAEQILFEDVYNGETSPTLSLAQWLCNILVHIGKETKQIEDPFFQESLFRTYTLVNRLLSLIEAGDLVADITTFRRLLWQLLQSATIPFHGEPAEGIQIMGVLETRNLDFDHVLILSCNEGNMPKNVNDASFIPYSVRKAYELTTIDHKVAIYAYYFHSILQRATDVTICYNNSTEDGNRGEMSRFPLQFMVENPHQKIRQAIFRSPHDTTVAEPHEISKDAAIQEHLKNLKYLSPTDIGRYLRCPLQFYFDKVAGLSEPDSIEDDNIDHRTFGNIFHRAAQLIYEGMPATVTANLLQAILNDPHALAGYVDRAFNEVVLGMRGEKTPRNPQIHYNGLQLINRDVIIFYLRQLLNLDLKLTPFSIRGCEKRIFIPEGRFPKPIKGVIDRLDAVTNIDGTTCIRVVDYKTGKTTQQAISSVEDIFRPEFLKKKHTEYYLQTMLYACIVADSPELNPQHLAVSPALLFVQHTGEGSKDPTLEIDKTKITDINAYAAEFETCLRNLMNEMLNPEVAFTPTDDRTRCDDCPFKKICYS